MLFSCKITHSVITYLDRRGEDLEVLYESCDWPAEFLRDPSSWLEAEKMENLLRRIDAEYSRKLEDDEGLIAAVGHHCKDLRSWGVLDSVLRMVQASKDLFAQPERFLSYFISPAPPVGEVRRSSDSVGFVLPVSELQFPMVTMYLRAALEALPTYISKSMARVTWENSRVEIQWSEDQASLFGDGDKPDLSLHPELVRNILLNFESTQKELEEMKRALLIKDEEIKRLRERPPERVASNGDNDGDNDLASGAGSGANVAPTNGESMLSALGEITHELYRLGDYIARGQQLITLLIGQGRQTPQVQEAMRRVDWDYVSTTGPQIVKRAVDELHAMKKSLEESAQRAKESPEANLKDDDLQPHFDFDLAERDVSAPSRSNGHSRGPSPSL